MTFLGMHRGKEELKGKVTAVGLALAFALSTAYDPVAAGFGFAEGVETTGDGFEGIAKEDDLDAGGGLAVTTMHDDSARLFIETEVEIVQNRIDMTIVGFMFGCLLHVRCFCVFKSRDIYRVYIRCCRIRF